MKPTYQQITEAIGQARQIADERWLECLGIRTQEQPFELGTLDHSSVAWDDGEETGEELDGVCATRLDAPEVRMHASDYSPLMGYYFGEHVAIVAGSLCETGQDAGEVIIRDPEVIMVLS